MMDYWIEQDVHGFKVLSGDRSLFALVNNMRDAALIVQMSEIFEDMVQQFPGLLDGEQDVNGGDLVEFFNNQFEGAKTLKSYLAGDGEYKDDEEVYDPAAEETC